MAWMCMLRLIVLEIPHPVGPRVGEAGGIELPVPLESPQFLQSNLSNMPIQKEHVNTLVVTVDAEMPHLSTCAGPLTGLTRGIATLVCHAVDLLCRIAAERSSASPHSIAKYGDVGASHDSGRLPVPFGGAFLNLCLPRARVEQPAIKAIADLFFSDGWVVPAHPICVKWATVIVPTNTDRRFNSHRAAKNV